ncbi:hypothetical protein [Chitinophaga sp.]|uniref:hypothetical protein n=1 Tax=Chitinophaga sp. TaxID=1869181 RepID=UPI002F94F404
MKTSRKKFVFLFLISGFTFLFLYNTFILSDMRGMPHNSAAFLGSDSLTGWRSIVSTILYPIKIVLLGPVRFLIDLPDPPPPFVGIGVAIYWTILALAIHYVISKIKRTRKA